MDLDLSFKENLCANYLPYCLLNKFAVGVTVYPMQQFREARKGLSALGGKMLSAMLL